MNVFVKLLLISYRYSGLFSMALDDPGLLGRLQGASNQYRLKVQAGDAEKARAERNQSLAAEANLVSALRYDEEFWALLETEPNLTNSAAAVRQLSNWFRTGV